MLEPGVGSAQGQLLFGGGWPLMRERRTHTDGSNGDTWAGTELCCPGRVSRRTDRGKTPRDSQGLVTHQYLVAWRGTRCRLPGT